jgi:predicted nucleotidyltransferase
MSTATRIHPVETEPGSVLFGQTRLRVLGWLFGHSDQAYYLRQLVRQTGAAHGAVQRELATLVGAGLLRRTVEGRQVYFQANREAPIFPELRALLAKTTGPVEVVRRALEPFADRILVALIFGSAARGDLRNDSDVDLLVVGDTPFATVVEALGTAQERLGREINPTVYPAPEFRAKLLEGHHFLTGVLREPYLFVLGGADELDRLGEERLAHSSSDER